MKREIIFIVLILSVMILSGCSEFDKRAGIPTEIENNSKSFNDAIELNECMTEMLRNISKYQKDFRCVNTTGHYVLTNLTDERMCHPNSEEVTYSFNSTKEYPLNLSCKEINFIVMSNANIARKYLKSQSILNVYRKNCNVSLKIKEDEMREYGIPEDMILSNSRCGKKSNCRKSVNPDGKVIAEECDMEYAFCYFIDDTKDDLFSSPMAKYYSRDDLIEYYLKNCIEAENE